MQPWQHSLLCNSCSRIQAPQQAGETDETKHTDGLVHFRGQAIVQTLKAGLVQNNEHDLQGEQQRMAASMKEHLCVVHGRCSGTLKHGSSQLQMRNEWQGYRVNRCRGCHWPQTEDEPPT